MSAPITRQRSAWEFDREGDFAGWPHVWHRRNVGDGTLLACVGEELQGWHLSISFRDHRARLSRYPTWDEILDARQTLLPSDIEFIMYLPTPENYVALHDTTFHLHEHPERQR